MFLDKSMRAVGTSKPPDVQVAAAHGVLSVGIDVAGTIASTEVAMDLQGSGTQRGTVAYAVPVPQRAPRPRTAQVLCIDATAITKQPRAATAA